MSQINDSIVTDEYMICSDTMFVEDEKTYALKLECEILFEIYTKIYVNKCKDYTHTYS